MPDERWEGRLCLGFERRQSKTCLSSQYVSMPLAFQKVLYPEGERICHGVILHPPGGFAKDDQLIIHVELGQGAEVLLTSPGASKFYKSSLVSRQEIFLMVSEGAHLEWLPQESIIFDGARMHSSLRVELAPGSTWSGWDIWRFGRSGAGERFSDGHWRSAAEVWRLGRPLWIDHQELAGGSYLLDSPFGLHGQTVLGTFTWLGMAILPDLLDVCRRNGTAAIGKANWGISRLEEGLVVRYRGASSAQARKLFVAIWNILRESLRQCPPCLPRVWNT